MKHESIVLSIKETGSAEKCLEIESLEITTEQLKAKCADLTGAKANEMKLIHKGIILKEGQTLKAQQISAHSRILIFKTASAKQQAQVQQIEEKSRKIDQLKKATEEVAQRADGGSSSSEQFYFELEDQNGNPINLPQQVRKDLICGMTLQKKGKSLVRKQKYLDALECFREGDNAFQRVPSNLLSAVDNYALCQIDMVWCMLKLKAPEMVGEAKRRLTVARQILEQVHGKNLERLKQVKRDFTPEQAIYPRLHMLLCIAEFHDNNIFEAKRWLNYTDLELKTLMIKPEQATALLNMGFSNREVRIALRAANGDLSAATNFILQKRDKEATRRRAERERKQRRQKQLAFGTTNNGSLIDIDMLDKLKRQAPSTVDEDLVVYALKQTNNKDHLAIQLLTDEYKRKVCEANVEKEVWTRVEPSSKTLQQVMQLGFDETRSRYALKKTRGRVQEAINSLLEGSINPQLSPPPRIENNPTPLKPEPQDIQQQEQLQQPKQDIQHPDNVQEAIDKVIGQMPPEGLDELHSSQDDDLAAREILSRYAASAGVNASVIANASEPLATYLPERQQTADDIVAAEVANTFGRHKDSDSDYDINLDEEFALFEQYKKLIGN